VTEPVPDPERYRAALAAFREVINGPRVGVSTIPEIEHLRVLIQRYPDEAKRVLAELTPPADPVDPTKPVESADPFGPGDPLGCS
jgi:hypothetical protein